MSDSVQVSHDCSLSSLQPNETKNCASFSKLHFLYWRVCFETESPFINMPSIWLGTSRERVFLRLTSSWSNWYLIHSTIKWVASWFDVMATILDLPYNASSMKHVVILFEGSDWYLVKSTNHQIICGTISPNNKSAHNSNIAFHKVSKSDWFYCEM